MEQELLTISGLVGVALLDLLFSIKCFADRYLHFFVFVVLLSVILRYTASYCPFDIVKLFFTKIVIKEHTSSLYGSLMENYGTKLII